VGATLACKLKLDGKSYDGTAMLETETLEFKGEVRLKIPFKSITRVLVEKDALKVLYDSHEASFVLGDAADKWLQKILHPKSLLDKLGVKPEEVVVVLGINDDDFLQQLRERVKTVHAKLSSKSDVIFFGAEKAADLDSLKKCKTAINKDGAVWIVNPKGVKTITEAQVLAAGKKAGLVDIKVVKFSETHTAHKFVIPKSKR
jgi:hypothetical protein